jgi:hypothetical protein
MSVTFRPNRPKCSICGGRRLLIAGYRFCELCDKAEIRKKWWQRKEKK